MFFSFYLFPPSSFSLFSSFLFLFLFFPFLFFFIRFVVRPRHLFITNLSHLSSTTIVARPEPLFLSPPPLSLSDFYPTLAQLVLCSLARAFASTGYFSTNHRRYSQLVRDLSEPRAFHTPSNAAARAKARALASLLTLAGFNKKLKSQVYRTLDCHRSIAGAYPCYFLALRPTARWLRGINNEFIFRNRGRVIPYRNNAIGMR